MAARRTPSGAHLHSIPQLLALGAVGLALVGFYSAVRLGDSEPFPAVSFPSFSKPASEPGAERVLAVATDAGEWVEFAAPGLRGSFEAELVSTLIDRLETGAPLSPDEAAWLGRQVTGLEGCPVAVSLLDGNSLVVDRLDPPSSEQHCG